MRNTRIWSLAISLLVGLGGILYGYDIGVISGALTFINQAIPLTSAQVGIIVGAVIILAIIRWMQRHYIKD